MPVRDIGIEPVEDLATTAALLGTILGADFVRDTSGTYEEYPAFLADVGGVKWALLGLPAPEDDIRDIKSQHFELMFEDADQRTIEDSNKIADALISRLNSDGRIRCWPLD